MTQPKFHYVTKPTIVTIRRRTGTNPLPGDVVAQYTTTARWWVECPIKRRSCKRKGKRK